jgi:arsenite methyltransferase
VKEVPVSESKVTELVREKYAAVAASGLSGESAGVRAVAEAFGYTPDELAGLPAGANMGLSCGNPTATANLRPGEVVVDLGCGGGIDVFLAARKVGPTGKAVGIDMTPEMIDRARRNAERLAANGERLNVEFHLARMEQMPLPENSVDCLVSNCVINLAADKAAVFREMLRVLKPGGRVAVSDIALKQPLPDEVARSVAALVGCVAGALPVAEYERLLREAGFAAVQVVDTKKDLNAYAKVEGQSGCCSPAMDPEPVRLASSPCSMPEVTEEEWVAAGQSCCGGQPEGSPVHGGLGEVLAKFDVNRYAASVQVYAVKPAK